MPRSLLLIALLGLGCAAGCAGSSAQIETGAPPDAPVRLLAVYPVALRYEAPAYRSYELAMDEVTAALDTRRLLVLGPSEFTVERWEADSLGEGAKLDRRLLEVGLRAGDAAALRGWIERREQQGSDRLYDANGKPKGLARTAQVTYVLHEELLGAHGQGPLAQGSVEVEVDPFADHPAWDETPEVRRALTDLTRALLARVGASLGSRQERGPGCKLDFVPWDEERFSLPGRPALEHELNALDSIDADAQRLLRLAYFSPDIPAARQSALLTSPGGLFVRDVERRWADAGLREGDVIVQVESDKVVGPQTLRRRLDGAPSAAALKVKVQRDGTIVPLELPGR